MFTALAKFLLQLEKLWKNPVAWFGQQHWVIRLCTILAIVPLISVFSISWYIAWHQPSSQSEQLLTQNYQELRDLKIAVEENNQKQLAEIRNLKKDVQTVKNSVVVNRELSSNADKTVLGDRSEASESGKMIRILAKNNDGKVIIYKEPKTTAPVLTTIDQDARFFYKTKLSGWYELDFYEGATGWVQAKYVQE